MMATILNFVLFLIIFVLLFYPFGYFLVSKTKEKLSDYEYVLLSFASSIVVFVILAMFFGFLKVRFLMLPTFIIINLFSIIHFKGKLFKSILGIFKDWIFDVIAVVSVLVQGFINFPSGYLYKDGFLFWSSQGNDGLWHVSLMEEIKKTMPLLNPTFSGEKMVNYHYLVDVLMGEFGRIFPFFSSMDLYFRFFTIIFAFLIILSIFTFLTRWQSNKKVGYWGIFFTIFAGSFGYIVTYLKNGKWFSGETVFWAAQGNTIIGNPPHAISYFLITTSFLCLYFYFKNHKKSWLILTFLLSSLLAGFKVPAGFIFLAGVGLASVVNFVRTRDPKPFSLLILSGLTNFGIIKFLTRGVESFLIFEPWWFIRTMIVVPERLGIITMEFRRQFYMAQHTWHAYLRVLQLELGGLFIFIIGNLGAKFLGIYEIYKRYVFNLRKTLEDPINTVLLGSMVSGLLVTLLFVQKGIAYNNIAFMQYFILIFGFFAAISIDSLMKKIKHTWLKVSIIIILVFFSIPTVVGNLVDFYNRPALAKISNAEIAGLNFLKTNSGTNTVVLTLPFDKGMSDQFKTQPWPIGVWYPTSYVSALADVRTYLSSELQAEITGYDIDPRLLDEDKFFSEKDLTWNKSFLKTNGIKYIYLTKFQKPTMEKADYLKNVFENSEVVIYQVI